MTNPEKAAVGYNVLGLSMRWTAVPTTLLTTAYGTWSAVDASAISEPAIPHAVREQQELFGIRHQVTRAGFSARQLSIVSDVDAETRVVLENLSTELGHRLEEIDSSIEELARHPETIAYAHAQNNFYDLQREITTDILGATSEAAVTVGAGLLIMSYIFRRQAKRKAAQPETI